MNEEAEAVLRDIEAVLTKHGASLFFSTPATLWIRGEEVAGVTHVSDSDGSELELIREMTDEQN